MAERSSSSATMSRTRCAGCPSGTNSCTEGGSSQASSTFQGRKLFVMPTSESPPASHVEPLQPLPGLLADRLPFREADEAPPCRRGASFTSCHQVWRAPEARDGRSRNAPEGRPPDGLLLDDDLAVHPRMRRADVVLDPLLLEPD